MASYAEYEPQEEYAIVADPWNANKKIVITNRNNVQDNSFLQKKFNLKNDSPNVLNVAESCIPCLDQDDAPILRSDAYVDNKNMRKAVTTFTDYALYIHLSLLKYDTFVLCCKNGRSRSPNVILAFLVIFRGMSNAMASPWLTALFKSQRPTIASKSAEFPNFGKFFNAFNEIERIKTTTDTYLHKRIHHVSKKYFEWAYNNNNSGSSSNSSNSNTTNNNNNVNNAEEFFKINISNVLTKIFSVETIVVNEALSIESRKYSNLKEFIDNKKEISADLLTSKITRVRKKTKLVYDTSKIEEAAEKRRKAKKKTRDERRKKFLENMSKEEQEKMIREQRLETNAKKNNHKGTQGKRAKYVMNKDVDSDFGSNIVRANTTTMFPSFVAIVKHILIHNSKPMSKQEIYEFCLKNNYVTISGVPTFDNLRKSIGNLVRVRDIINADTEDSKITTFQNFACMIKHVLRCNVNPMTKTEIYNYCIENKYYSRYNNGAPTLERIRGAVGNNSDSLRMTEGGFGHTPGKYVLKNCTPKLMSYDRMVVDILSKSSREMSLSEIHKTCIRKNYRHTSGEIPTEFNIKGGIIRSINRSKRVQLVKNKDGVTTYKLVNNNNNSSSSSRRRSGSNSNSNSSYNTINNKTATPTKKKQIKRTFAPRKCDFASYSEIVYFILTEGYEELSANELLDRTYDKGYAISLFPREAPTLQNLQQAAITLIQNGTLRKRNEKGETLYFAEEKNDFNDLDDFIKFILKSYADPLLQRHKHLTVRKIYELSKDKYTVGWQRLNRKEIAKHMRLLSRQGVVNQIKVDDPLSFGDKKPAYMLIVKFEEQDKEPTLKSEDKVPVVIEETIKENYVPRVERGENTAAPSMATQGQNIADAVVKPLEISGIITLPNASNSQLLKEPIKNEDDNYNSSSSRRGKVETVTNKDENNNDDDNNNSGDDNNMTFDEAEQKEEKLAKKQMLSLNTSIAADSATVPTTLQANIPTIMPPSKKDLKEKKRKVRLRIVQNGGSKTKKRKRMMDEDASPKKKIQINKLNSGWIDNSSHGSIPVENNMEQSIAGTKTTVLSQNNATRSFPVIVIPPSTEEVTTSDESSSSDSGIPPEDSWIEV